MAKRPREEDGATDAAAGLAQQQRKEEDDKWDPLTDPKFRPLEFRQPRVPSFSVGGAEGLRPPPHVLAAMKAAGEAIGIGVAGAQAAARGGPVRGKIGVQLDVHKPLQSLGPATAATPPAAVALGVARPPGVARGAGLSREQAMAAAQGPRPGRMAPFPMPPAAPAQKGAKVPAPPQGSKAPAPPQSAAASAAAREAHVAALQRLGAPVTSVSEDAMGMDPKKPWMVGDEINFHWFLKAPFDSPLLDDEPELKKLAQRMHEHRQAGIRFVPPRGCTQFPEGWYLEMRRRGEVLEKIDLSRRWFLLMGTEKRKNDYVLPHSSASVMHMVWCHHPVQGGSGGCILLDLWSAHGTHLDGKKVCAQQPHRIEAGQPVKYGICQDEIVLCKPQAEPPAAAEGGSSDEEP
eukprot:TRINITY_DN3987_c0_g1_i1.p1 TRINITY_DN3987_c0_g1~~TRINITY_DN3987_c0_g1_i1.p1  ORF type:complete len:428 (+),score=109.66 TRINITY_DN3987_c0_g1_i1:73-1284(+)